LSVERKKRSKKPCFSILEFQYPETPERETLRDEKERDLKRDSRGTLKILFQYPETPDTQLEFQVY